MTLYARYRVYASLLLTLLAFVLPLVLYIKTLAPVYVAVDNAELALCMKFLGICHPPGYPLFILLGHVFVTLFGAGELVWRANLLGAIFGAATIFVVYLTLLSVKVSKIIAFLLAMLLAFSAVFWELATSVDVFTFGAFLLSCSLYFLFKNRPTGAFFALGLSASHSYLTGFLLPPFLWYFWPRNLKGFILPLLLFGLGFFPQILMFRRMILAPEINWGHVSSFWQFVDFVRRREFGGFFILAYEGIRFSFSNFYKHLILFLSNTLSNLGLILPLLVPFGLILTRLAKQKQIVLLLLSFLIIVLLQLLSVSTIDPTGEYSPLVASKFYLLPFIVLIFLIGVLFERSRNFFGLESSYTAGFLIILVAFNLLSNFRTHNMSGNYFSRDFIENSLGQLPNGSVAITVDHAFYFAGVYEQKINGKFGDVKLLYFANENNRDSEFYHPDLFSGNINREFTGEISRGKKLGRSEAYILETIGRNLDKPLYIRQGGFEETFFDYLAPYIRAHGLWWKVEVSGDNAVWDPEGGIELVSSFGGVSNPRDLYLRQQKIEALAYYVSYNSTAGELVKVGRGREAVSFLERVLEVTDQPETVRRKIKEIIN